MEKLLAGTEAWREARRQVLTATDVADLICWRDGFKHYRSPRQIWKEKIGIEQVNEPSEVMLRGTYLEPVVAALWVKRYQTPVVEGEYKSRGIYGATWDYQVEWNDGDDFDNVPLECKTTSQWIIDQWGEDETDQSHHRSIIQTMVQMYTGDAPIGFVSVLILDGNTKFKELIPFDEAAKLIKKVDFGQHRTYQIEWDPDYWKKIDAFCQAWWQRHVVEGVEPEYSALDLDDIKQEFPEDVLPIKEWNNDYLQDVTDYLSLSKRAKEANELLDMAKARLQGHIGEHAGLTTPYGTFTWKRSKDSEKVDTKKLIELLRPSQEVLQAVTVIQEGSRRFLFKENK